MSRPRLAPFVLPIAAACIGVALVAGTLRANGDSVPARFADEEFWRLVTSFSERPGSFPSDNLLSNERTLQDVIPGLTDVARPNRVYLGVGPEQNFTYIVALKPSMAFIVDVRRGNLDLHLMYKALFELSADRAEFVSRLFSRKRPDGLSRESSVTDIFDAFANVEAAEALYVENLRAIVNLLVKTHRFALGADDMLRLQRTHRAFYLHGPGIQYSSTRGSGRRDEPTYRDLMLATDATGSQRSYLASEGAFELVKALERDNLIVPLVGIFAGFKTIRAVGEFLADKGSTVSAFYLSNVEEYLRRDGTLPAFCANVATLPFDETSTFIRSVRSDTPGAVFRLSSQLGAMTSEMKGCETGSEARDGNSH